VSKNGYGVIAAVVEGSLAEKEGLRPGDRLVSINGHVLRDVMDYRFYGAEEELELVLNRDGQRLVLQIERGYEEELGLEFTAPTFDGIRRCHNQCAFCFMAGLPEGLRPSLYLRDDDYRYSFLFGNFITLTNLSEDDWERLAEQRLSPLYVSVHATDLALRRCVLGNPAAPHVMDQLRRLGELGIQLHTQVVLVPGLNDGPALAQTVADLVALYPVVQSIAIVPVGLTRYHRCGFRLYRPDEAGLILDQITAWQREYRRQHNLNLVYASDEWYLLAGRQIPPAEEYDDFPQLENGVGLTRVFLDEWEEAKARAPGLEGRAGMTTLVCGTLIAPLLEKIAAELGQLTGLQVRVISVTNAFFGPTVTVSGLLTGRDVIRALQQQVWPEHDPGNIVFLPRTMFDTAGKMTLDDMTPLEMGARLGARVELASRMGEVLETTARNHARSAVSTADHTWRRCE